MPFNFYIYFVTNRICWRPIGMKKLILINAIVWAAVLLIASWLFKEDPNYKYFFGVLVFAAGLMNALIHNATRGKRISNCIK